MRVANHAKLGPEELAALSEASSRLATLEQVIRWGLAQPVERLILEVVAQDEYTHDVVMQWRSNRYVVFDTT